MNDIIIQKLRKVKTELDFRKIAYDLAEEMLLINDKDLPANYKCYRRKARQLGVESEAMAVVEDLFRRDGSFCRIEGISDCNVDGTGELTIENLTAYLDANRISARYNVISHQVEYSGFVGESYEHLKEIAPAVIYNELHFDLKKCTIEMIMNYLNVIAARNKYNPILDMIHGVKWDGIDRIDEIYNIFGIPREDKLSRSVIHKWLLQCWCGLHNSMENPFSLDIVLVFQGKQGIGKTRFLEKLCMKPVFFGEGRTYDPRNKDSQIECTSKWICELGEIGSTMKKDVDSLKAFITSSTDEYRLPYGKSALRYARMTSFCGTTNDMQFLVDTTGNRRFATVSVPEGVVIDYDRDVKNFNSLQLWAQVCEEVEAILAVSDYDYSSVFRLTRGELEELEKRNSDHVKPMKGELEVMDVLEENSRAEEGFVCEEMYMTVTEFIERNESLRKYSSLQISKVLDKLGYPMIKRRVEGKSNASKIRFLPCKRRVKYSKAN